jgi:hypothetical protein
MPAHNVSRARIREAVSRGPPVGKRGAGGVASTGAHTTVAEAGDTGVAGTRSPDLWAQVDSERVAWRWAVRTAKRKWAENEGHGRGKPFPFFF